MRRLRGLFDEVRSVGNLRGAWTDFRRNKGGRPTVRAFAPGAERAVWGLHRALSTSAYRHGPYKLLYLHEPKRRLIAAARIRDRIVHHAVHRALSPHLDRSLIDTTYACLPGRGSHRAVLRLVRELRRRRYLLMLDVRHYFLSIDRGILLDLMARRLKDRRLLELLRVIADSGEGIFREPGVAEFLGLDPDFPPPGCGLPIGNLTSQWWGNHYLSGLDHFVKRELKIPHYQRYLDDLTLLADSRSQLEEAREAIANWLGHERRLKLKHPNAAVRDTGGRVTYLGYRISRAGVRPSASMLKRMEQRIGEQVLDGDPETIEHALASYRGVWLFVDTVSKCRRQ
jgi:hypothetical protein